MASFMDSVKEFFTTSKKAVVRTFSRAKKASSYKLNKMDAVARRRDVISELGENWATVRTVIDVDVSIGAHAGISSTTGMIMGEFSLMQQGYSKLTYLTDTSNVAAGDTVLTSGKGGYIPQGLIIGTITELRSEAGGQMIFGVVEPVCDLDSISQVFIILEHTIVTEE